MAQNHFLAGVGTALIFNGDNLIGVAETLTESTFDFAITAEDVRGGKGNALLGRYFHDSSLTATLTDAMFDLNYMALSLGVDVEMGGLSIKEEEVTANVGSATVTEDPIAFNGSMIGWYKKPTDRDWQIGTLTGNTMTISGAQSGESYCVKYFYNNENAKSITIKSQYVPSVIHIVVMTDLYSGEVGTQNSATRYGRLIVDIPQFQLGGNQNLSLTASSAATINLTGMALAVLNGATCDDDPYYGTMTEEIYGANWQDEVVALAAVNSDIDLSVGGSEVLDIRAVFGGGVASQKKDNTYFTFTSNAASTASVDTNGTVKGVAKGNTTIEVTLNGANVDPCYVSVSVQ